MHPPDIQWQEWEFVFQDYYYERDLKKRLIKTPLSGYHGMINIAQN
jgi:hypothetical protein